MVGISIVVPVYNMGEYLNRCLDSILNQSYRDIEVILVNDGSTDNSLEICNEYAAKDNRIKVIDKPNGGVSSARNSGLDKVSKEYIAFVDPDDYIEHNMMEELLKLAEKYNADLVWSNLFSDDYKDKSVSKVNIVKENEFFNLEDGKELTNFAYKLARKYNMSAYSVNKIYHRSLFQNIRYPLKRNCEDGFILMEIIQRVKRVVTTTEAYYHYCQRPKGLCQGNRDEAWEIDWIESRVVQAIIFNHWDRYARDGVKEYLLYKAYKNALLFEPKKMYEYHEAYVPSVKKELKKLLKSNLSIRHKISVYKVLLKYEYRCRS